jgi:DNA-binding phage protein
MAGPIRTMPYDSADYLDSEEAIAAYLRWPLKTGILP